MPAEAAADILVVDDNPESLAALADMLRGRSYKVRPADSGARALRAAALSPPDLVMLDINMPGLDGYEVCRRLKADPATREVPVIFLSVNADAVDKVTAFGVGGTDYVTKPFQVDEVCARVELQLTLARTLKALAERNRELAEANREKSRILGVAAHDLRGPLAILSWGAELLGEEGLTEPPRELLQTMLASATRMSALIDDLLDVALTELGELRLVRSAGDLAATVREVVRLQQILAQRKRITLELDAPDGLPSAAFDAHRVRQVLENLLGNAVKYSPPGSVVRVRVQAQPEHLQVSVADQGPGVPGAERARLFRFFGKTSVKPTGGERSTGLGLAIARRVVEAHGGRLWLEAGPGPGSTFSFSLPLPPAG